MKRILLALLILGMFAIPVEADQHRLRGELKTYSIDNNTGENLVTLVPTDDASDKDIKPEGTAGYRSGDRLLGYTVLPTQSLIAGDHTEIFVALYDTTSQNTADNEVISECEVLTYGTDTTWFPYPRIIKSGINASQGAFTTVLIYYER